MKLDDPNWWRARVAGVRYVACSIAGPARMSIERVKWLIGTPERDLARWADDGGRV